MSVFEKLSCRMSGHVDPARPVWNDHHFFGRCARCGTDLCRLETGGWRPIPRGFRVVWKCRDAADAPPPRAATLLVWGGHGDGALHPAE